MRYPVAAAFACLACQASPARAHSCNDNHYVNSSGHVVHSPSCGEEHEKRTAECRDGSVSFSEHRRGTCSYHGGVAHWDWAVTDRQFSRRFGLSGASHDKPQVWITA